MSFKDFPTGGLLWSPAVEVRRETKRLLSEKFKQGTRPMFDERLCTEEEDFFIKPALGSPEKNLCASILERAIFDLASPEWTVRRDAEQWFASDKQDRFSLYWILDVLGFAHAHTAIQRITRKIAKETSLKKRQQCRYQDVAKMWEGFARKK